MDVQSGESEEEEVMGEEIGESEMKELVPEWGWQRDKGADSRDKVKHNVISYFLYRMMMSVELLSTTVVRIM